MGTDGGLDAYAEPWRTVGTAGNPPFQNGWGHHPGGAVQFRKVRIGIAEYVEFRGLATTTGAAASTAFTLPVGYRPPLAQWHPITVSSGIGIVQVDVTGTVHISSIAAPAGADPANGAWLHALRVPIT